MTPADDGTDRGSDLPARPPARDTDTPSHRRRTWICAVLIACTAGGSGTLARTDEVAATVPGATRATASIPPPARPSTALAFPPRDELSVAAERLSVSGSPDPTRFERPEWGSFEHVEALSVTPGRRESGRRFVVVIDPGHGGRDPGAEAPNGLLEKELTLDIAHRVRRFMAEFGDIDIVLTREDDSSMSRRARVNAVRAIEADLFVSLHFNHLPQSEVTLVESYYAGADNIAESRALQRSSGVQPQFLRLALEAPPDTTLTHGSERFATLVQRRVFDEVSRHDADAIDAGTKRDTLFMLTRSFTSGALVELTCLSNAEEAHRLTESAYRVGLAAALVDAIRDYRASLRSSPLDGAGV